MSKDHKALNDAEMCIKLQPDWAKGYYRKGCALRELLREEEAIKVLHKAVTLAPKDTEIRAKYNEVKQRCESYPSFLAFSQTSDISTG